MSEPTDSQPTEAAMQRALVQSGAVIALGLLVQMATLPWARPAAFLTFLGVGGTLVVLGVTRYLWAVLRVG